MTTQANIDNIETMIAFFGSFDKGHKFDMSDWVHPCGAPSCVAGYTVAQLDSQKYDEASALSKATLAFEALYDVDLIDYKAKDRLDEQHIDLCQKSLGTPTTSDFFPKRAAELLGLTHDESQELFFPSGDYWDDIEDKTKAKNAHKVLKQVLKDVNARVKEEGFKESGGVFSLTAD